MTKASDNAFPSLLVVEGTAPASPSAGDQRLYIDSADHHLKRKNSSGTVTDLESGSASLTYVGAKAYNSTTQNVNNTAAALTFDTEEFDTNAFHDTSSNTSRMTIPSGKDGKYLLQAGSFSSGSADFCYFKKNGTTIIRGGQTFGRASASYQQAQAIVSLVATDYVEFFVSTTLNLNFGHASALDAQSWFAVTFLGA